MAGDAMSHVVTVAQRFANATFTNVWDSILHPTINKRGRLRRAAFGRGGRMRKMARTSADRVADYLIRAFHECGDFITNLKLQKLLY